MAGTEIPPRVGLEGADYAYVDRRASKPGDRTLTWTPEPSTAVRYYDVLSGNSTAQGSPIPGVTASHDNGSCRVGWSLPRARTGGCLLPAGKPHTITVTLDAGLPGDAFGRQPGDSGVGP